MSQFSTFNADQTKRPVLGSIRSISASELNQEVNKFTDLSPQTLPSSHDSPVILNEPVEIDGHSEVSSTSTSLSYQGHSITKEDEEEAEGQKTYHERQFDVILSDEVVDLSFIRCFGRVSLDFLFVLNR